MNNIACDAGASHAAAADYGRQESREETPTKQIMTMTFHKILSFTSAIIASLYSTECFAFIPSRNVGNRILTTSLNAVAFDRRQALESLLVASTSSFAILAGGAGNANAAENPALKTFKGTPRIIPGLSIRFFVLFPNSTLRYSFVRQGEEKDRVFTLERE